MLSIGLFSEGQNKKKTVINIQQEKPGLFDSLQYKEIVATVKKSISLILCQFEGLGK